MAVQDPDDVIGCCSECHSDQTMQYMERSPFAQAGDPPPCQYCGGVVIVTFRETRDSALGEIDQRRGL
jgi:hypothetical protein